DYPDADRAGPAAEADRAHRAAWSCPTGAWGRGRDERSGRHGSHLWNTLRRGRSVVGGSDRQQRPQHPGHLRHETRAPYAYILAPLRRALLLSMPVGALERPALGISLLKARLAESGVACDVRYLTFTFAELVGCELYQWMTYEMPYTAFAGDWSFTQALY